MPKRIALTGVTGFIGAHVLERLLLDGHQISCLVRAGRVFDRLPGVRYCVGELRDPDSLRELLDGAETVVHLAGLTRAKTEAEYNEVNALAVERLVALARTVSPAFEHIVAMSSLAAMGPARDESGICEDEPFQPITPYGRSKALLESLAAPGVAWTFIRAPGVYGPRDKDFLQYFKLVNKGLRLVIGKRNLMSLVYVKNLADAIAACVQKPEARGEAFFIADEGCYDWDDIGHMIEACLEKKTLRLRVPFWAVRVASLFSLLAMPFVRVPPLLNKHKLAEMSQEYWVVSTEKARKILGYSPRIDTKTAFCDTARWYAEQGWL